MMPDHDMTKFIIMGVAGSGKSSVGSALARELGAVFIDGDDMHPKENIAKMSSGRPLTDDDRNPWLQNIGMALNSNIGTVVIACSALKKIYRDIIREASGQAVMFIHLAGSFELIEDRMAHRTDHFMLPDLLKSQFSILENPVIPECFIEIDIGQSIEAVVEEVLHNVSFLC
jgi:gluconokinase